jgi:hypothetical protein
MSQTAAPPYEFLVYASGLCYASVCTSLSGEEAAARMFPAGTRRGWQLSEEGFVDGTPNGTPCDRYPDTHRHFLLDC